MQSNPFQQRIELMAEKWEDAKMQPDARFVLLQCQPDELDMADTFYTYMIGADTTINDIAFHFDSHCYIVDSFSSALLKELEEVMEIWNNSTKDARIEYVPISWQPDYTLSNPKNPAALFVENFNRLAIEMDLPEGYFAVAIFKVATMDKNFATWLRYAAETKIDGNVKFLLHELVAKPQFSAIAVKFPGIMEPIQLNLTMPKAMEQAAAMGDPTDPATTYRHTFMKMINAMGAGKENEAEKWGRDCMALAEKNISKDPYWVMQVVVVNIALGNDKIRYKKMKETVAYATAAVESAIGAQAFFEKNAGSGLLSQALMFRGSVFFMQSNWHDGHTDFSTAFDLFCQQGNVPLAVEASRMGGQCAVKSSQKKAGLQLWVKGARLGEKMDPDMARASTYAALLKQLLANDYYEFMPAEELHQIAYLLYGADWANVVRNWNKAPGETVAERQNREMVNM